MWKDFSAGGVMREIKFRAWKISQKSMFYPKGEGGFIIDLPQIMLDKEDDILMQYTGLKDKNGKEIFEGDIMDFSCISEKDEPTKGEVKFENGHFYLTNIREIFSNCLIHWQSEEWNKYKIIGNIYENPECPK